MLRLSRLPSTHSLGRAHKALGKRILFWYKYLLSYSIHSLIPSLTLSQTLSTTYSSLHLRFLDMSFWVPPPLPKTKLGRYRQLSPLAGVHLSPLCLGAMSIGDKWDKIGMGSMDKEQSFKLLDAFYEAGGNFIDTSNN